MSELYAIIVNNVLKGVEVSECAAVSLAKQLSLNATSIVDDRAGLLPNFSGNMLGGGPPEALILKVGVTAEDSGLDTFSLRGGTRYHMQTDFQTRATKLYIDDVPFSSAEFYLNQVTGIELIDALKEKAALETATSLVSDHFDVDNSELQTKINLYTSILNFKVLQGTMESDGLKLSETVDVFLANKQRYPGDGVYLGDFATVRKANDSFQERADGLRFTENVSVELTTLQHSIKVGLSSDATYNSIGFQDVLWDAEVWKDGLIHSNVIDPERIEFTKAGRYLIVISLDWSLNVLNFSSIQLYNASSILLDSANGGATSQWRTDSMIVEADLSDYIVIQVNPVGGTPNDLHSGGTTASIHLLR